MSVPCNVYWYELLVTWPPMRIAGMFCTYALMPVTRASGPRSCWITTSALGRWLRGFSATKMRPTLSDALGPPAPTDDIAPCT